MKNRRNKNLVFIITLLVMSLGIGYAFITTNLSINGATSVDDMEWIIYWDNVQVTNGSVTGDQVTTAPTISNNGTTVTYHINLKEPGEYYEFTVDAVNDGGIDAMTETIVKKVNNSTTIPEYLNYSVKYAIGTGIEEGQLLPANSSETYVVRVEYRTDIDPSVLPSTAQSLSLMFSVTYVQTESYAQQVFNYVYSTKDFTAYFDDTYIPTREGLYDTSNDALNSWDNDYYLRHRVENDIIQYSEIGYVVDGIKYYLPAGDPDLYESNKEKLRSVFGRRKCGTATYGTREEYTCSNDTIMIATTSEGEAGVMSMQYTGNDSEWACWIQNPRGQFYGYCGVD